MINQIQPIQNTTAATDFDVHQFYALSAKIGDVKGSEPLPPDAYPLDVSKPVTMASTHYDCLLQFYHIQYQNPELDDFRHIREGKVYLDGLIETMKTITLM